MVNKNSYVSGTPPSQIAAAAPPPLQLKGSVADISVDTRQGKAVAGRVVLRRDIGVLAGKSCVALATDATCGVGRSARCA